MLSLVYHPGYNVNLGDHVSPATKYGLVRARFSTWPVVSPEPAPRSALLRVHSLPWVTALLDGTLTPDQIQKLQLPWSQEMSDRFLLATGGTILAGHIALLNGGACNLGGGHHHAFPDHGEGFCAINDIAVAIRALQAEGRIRRAMVVDTDVHHGNGTAAIFASDPSVFTLDIHQRNNYPLVKPPADCDLPLDDGVEDVEYLAILGPALEAALAEFLPDILFYVSGADPYHDDLLGGLALTFEGLFARDELVFRAARDRRIPVVATLAGGYARRMQDTVTIHSNTVRALHETLSQDQ